MKKRKTPKPNRIPSPQISKNERWREQSIDEILDNLKKIVLEIYNRIEDVIEKRREEKKREEKRRRYKNFRIDC